MNLVNSNWINIVATILFISQISVPSTFGARILAVVPMPSYSHQVAFHPLWRELSSRGHQVTLVTANPINDPSLKNLKEIDVNFIYDEFKTMDKNKYINLTKFGLFEVWKEMASIIIDKELRHPDVQKLINDANDHYDVALIETIYPGMAVFAERFKCPLIQISSMDSLSVFYYLMGSPSHPILNTDFWLPLLANLNFLERLKTAAYTAYSVLYYKYVMFPSQDLILKEHFGDGLQSLEEILKKTSMMFVNTDPIFHPVRPLLPNIIQMGGGSHLAKPKPLSKTLQSVLDGAKHGVIYFSLGTNIQSSTLPPHVLTIFLETFSELPQTIVWKFEEEDLQGKPANVFISKWLPQQDILRHPNIKLFISQGGQQSLDEAVHNHIPVIGIPFIGDQENNVNRMERLGCGIGLDLSVITKATFKSAIAEVINNPKYRNKVKHLSELLKDQPMTGLERAVWWTEYVIRHKGAEHLKSPAVDLPFYQYYLLDVIGVCLLVVLIVLFVLIKLLKLAFLLLMYLVPKQKIKTQ